MAHSAQQNPGRLGTVTVSLFCGLVMLTVFSMVVPYWTALAAGLASISLVLFGATSVALVIVLYIQKKSSRALILATLVASLCALVVPQLAYLKVALDNNTKLGFEPREYLTFSGETTLPPSRTLTYKYAADQPLNIAFYRTNSPGPRPLVVVLHGGAWRYGSHLETGNWPQLLTANGFHVASVAYRLSSDTSHTWNSAPSDVHDALLYLTKNHDELAIDNDQIHALGQSAGGHLALLEAYRFQTVRSVISLYAPIDPALDFETSRDKSAELDFIGGPPAQYRERYRALSPLTYISPSSPPTLIIQGTRDDLVATKNATLLRSTLQRADVSHDLVLLPLTGHSFENQRGGFATQIAEQRVLRFLK